MAENETETPESVVVVAAPDAPDVPPEISTQEATEEDDRFRSELAELRSRIEALEQRQETGNASGNEAQSPQETHPDHAPRSGHFWFKPLRD